MPDPRQMSGIPRADPAVPAGTLTVRCLLGTFAQPAVGVTVSLRTADTGQEVRREAVADAAGRATFEGLDPLHALRQVAACKKGTRRFAQSWAKPRLLRKTEKQMLSSNWFL